MQSTGNLEETPPS